jgi:hypothetical protein
MKTVSHYHNRVWAKEVLGCAFRWAQRLTPCLPSLYTTAIFGHASETLNEYISSSVPGYESDTIAPQYVIGGPRSGQFTLKLDVLARLLLRLLLAGRRSTDSLSFSVSRLWHFSITNIGTAPTIFASRCSDRPLTGIPASSQATPHDY